MARKPKKKYIPTLEDIRDSIEFWEEAVREMEAGRSNDEWDYETHKRECLLDEIVAYEKTARLPIDILEKMLRADQRFRSFTIETDLCDFTNKEYPKDVYWFYYRTPKGGTVWKPA